MITSSNLGIKHRPLLAVWVTLQHLQTLRGPASGALNLVNTNSIIPGSNMAITSAEPGDPLLQDCKI
jgi:hypothetical protein